MIIDFNHDLSLLLVMEDMAKYDLAEDKPVSQERLALIREIAGGIAHEIRNPMTAVRGLLQVLGSKQECSSYKGFFDIMVEELDKTNAIISELLFLSSKSLINLKLHNLNDIVEALQKEMNHEAAKGHGHVTVELGEVMELVLCEAEITRLILNMVRNGLEAMPASGTLTIKTFTDGSGVVLSIRDQGPGIDPDILGKLGIPFITTKEQATGLGLAVCCGIAARHNATIDVDTGTSGTTFFVRFTQNIGGWPVSVLKE